MQIRKTERVHPVMQISSKAISDVIKISVSYINIGSFHRFLNAQMYFYSIQIVNLMQL